MKIILTVIHYKQAAILNKMLNNGKFWRMCFNPNQPTRSYDIDVGKYASDIPHAPYIIVMFLSQNKISTTSNTTKQCALMHVTNPDYIYIPFENLTQEIVNSIAEKRR